MERCILWPAEINFKKLTPKTLMFIENVGSPAVCKKTNSFMTRRVGCEAPLSLVL